MCSQRVEGSDWGVKHWLQDSRAGTTLGENSKALQGAWKSDLSGAKVSVMTARRLRNHMASLFHA